MDLEKIKRFANSEFEGWKIAKAVTEVKNEIKDAEQGRDVVMSDVFKTLREQGLQTPRKAGGKGLQTPRKAAAGLQVSQKPFLWQPPPFYGTWEGQGRGAKGKGLLLGDNSPFNNIPILGAIL